MLSLRAWCMAAAEGSGDGAVAPVERFANEPPRPRGAVVETVVVDVVDVVVDEVVAPGPAPEADATPVDPSFGDAPHGAGIAVRPARGGGCVANGSLTPNARGSPSIRR